MKETWLEREIHRMRNDVSLLKVFFSAVEEEPTVEAKGRFLQAHEERCRKAIEAIEKRMETIVSNGGKEETANSG